MKKCCKWLLIFFSELPIAISMSSTVLVQELDYKNIPGFFRNLISILTLSNQTSQY